MSIKLYSCAHSPNAQKIHFLLDLLKIDYINQEIDLAKGEQKQPWFLEINPNGKVPALEDVDATGKKQTVFESVAILNYIANKYDTKRQFSYSLDDPPYYQELEWTLFTLTELEGARSNQYVQLYLVPQKDEKVLEEAAVKIDRALSIIEDQLKKNGTGFLVGDHISIADIDAYPWVTFSVLPSHSEKFPAVKNWIEKIAGYKSS
ncbi:unnamed protein product [Ambrosiozyma monospora]|uniref:Unnamed protein product n=1 Tax=Ambrosiozyma monospora TaxID=43982 RepID=A0ACB5T2W4_AMBMO|nr:unnamed protein product [Ambrosiozyma monospora]